MFRRIFYKARLFTTSQGRNKLISCGFRGVQSSHNAIQNNISINLASSLKHLSSFSSSKHDKPSGNICILTEQQQKIDSQEQLQKLKTLIQVSDDNPQSYQQVMASCQATLNLVSQRQDMEIGLEVCNIAIDFCQKTNHTKESRLIGFKASKALFQAKISEKDVDAQDSIAVEKQFELLRDELTPEDKHTYLKQLCEVLFNSVDVQKQRKYAQEYFEQVQVDPGLNKDPLCLFTAYLYLFNPSFFLDEPSIALSLGLKAAAQIDKIKEKTEFMQFTLFQISLCYSKLGKPLESEVYLDKALDLSKQIAVKRSFTNLANNRYALKEYIESVGREYQEQQLGKNSENNMKVDDNNDLWNPEKDFGLVLKDQQNYKEAIDYYQKKISALGEKDFYKKAFYMDRLGVVFNESGDVHSGEQSCLSAHQLLLDASSGKLIPDSLMFQNLCNLKVLSLQQGKFTESIKWGDKWEAVGEKLGYFKVYDKAVKEDWMNQIVACREANQLSKGMSYSKKLEKYLDSFNRSQTYDMVNLKQQQFALQYESQNYKASLEILVELLRLIGTMYSKLQKKRKEYDQKGNEQVADLTQQEEELEEQEKINLMKADQLDYTVLKNIIILAEQTQNTKILRDYVGQFLEKFEQIEGSENFTRERYIAEISLSFIHFEKSEYSSAEVYVKKALLSAGNLKDAEGLQLESMDLLSHVLIEQNKFDEAINYAQKGIEIYYKLEAQSMNSRNNCELMELVQVISYAYKHKKDYDQALEWTGKYFQLNEEIKNKSNETQEQEAQMIQFVTALNEELKDQDLLKKLDEIIKKFNLKI